MESTCFVCVYKHLPCGNFTTKLSKECGKIVITDPNANQAIHNIGYVDKAICDVLSFLCFLHNIGMARNAHDTKWSVE